MKLSLPVFLMSILLLAGTAACSSSETIHESTVTEQSAETDTVEQDRAALEEIYWNRVETSRERFTRADVDFMIGMIAHHAQALIMSDLAFENDAHEEVQRLARRIHSAQLGEIAVMQQWLRDRGQPAPEVEIDGIELTLAGLDEPGQPHTTQKHHKESSETADAHAADPDRHDHSHADNETDEVRDRSDSPRPSPHMDHSDMPGMLSDDQLRELRDAGGSEFDRLFLEYMIEHHRGAVVMVDDLLATDGAAQDTDAFRLASDIHSDQVIEIRIMREMLERLVETQ